MNWLNELLIVAVVLGAIVVYLASMAGRLDRLHHRIETTHAALDAQLLRRGAAVQDLASSGFLDPASSLLLSASAQETLVVEPEDDTRRYLAESELTRTLGAVLETHEDVEELRAGAGADAEVADQLLEELAVACRRVELARRFHNDVVRSCLVVRRKRVVRWFRLEGYTPLPTTADFDDTPPAGLDGR
ncbi:MAG TPA: hypothetical protein VLV82_06355 [Candidatus Angelobacter sp.]|nr:hypothetical protein [Candidatus Angelobacter sp.]